MALFREKISAYDAGKGLSVLLRGPTVNELFKKFGEENSLAQACEIFCGVLWAIWIGIRKAGLQFPVSNLILDGMNSMFESPELYVALLQKLPGRISGYSQIMEKNLPDFSRAIFLVSAKLFEYVYGSEGEAKKHSKEIMEVCFLLPTITLSMDKAIKDVEKDYRIVA